jgi:hypothetical protein
LKTEDVRARVSGKAATFPTLFITANDAGDTDAGANNLQNFPVISSASVVSGIVLTDSLPSLMTFVSATPVIECADASPRTSRGRG